MEATNKKLKKLAVRIHNGKKIKIAILGLGSVGCYLLDYLMNLQDPNIVILILGRNLDKLEKDVNIIKTAATVRNSLKSDLLLQTVDLANHDELSRLIKVEQPDFIVNCSRAYSGIKYGSISWHHIRAYRIWTPLSISIIKSIMHAHENVMSNAIVINTSYSDAVNSWLKSAGMRYPDFGSGNLTHLIPRIKFAVANAKYIKNLDSIDITLATSHFHDVVICKEGQTENVDPLINISIDEIPIELDLKSVYKECAMAMPSDQKRNMMNASSNLEIIHKIINALREEKEYKFHSPGAFGLTGGYPINVDGKNIKISVCENYFSLTDMQKINRESIYLDGIENIENSNLIYTDE